ncbi:MAG: AI-2E family transporter [Proteobacteria bacterium]|nr:AI-2E family transporter [Pseudomonadota bacterium]
MTARAQIGAWAAGLFVFGLAVFALREMLFPFVAGLAVAYLLDPIADWLERRGLSRTLATVVITAMFMLVAVGAVLLLAPLVYEQLLGLIVRAPGYLSTVREYLAPLSETLIARLGDDQVEGMRAALAGFAERIVGWVFGLGRELLESGLAIVNLLALLFITPIVTFYLLRDWDRIVARFDSLLPRAQAEVIRTQCRLIDETLAAFVRGQGLVCLILGAFYAAGLMLVGLDFGLIVGLSAGLLSFIPYVGAIAGFVVGVTLALLQFDEPLRVGLVVAVFVVGQVAEGNLLTPKLVGERVGLHPVWVIFGVLAGATLFGFVGVLLALPVTAVIGVVVRFAADRYQASALFLGPAKQPGDDGDAAS